MPAKTRMTSGFLARVTFDQDASEYFSEDANQVMEMLYPEDEDVYEFIEFMQEHEDYVIEATVLFPDGRIIDARSLSTNAED